MDLRALIFLPALVCAVICGCVFLLFAAHYYLTVMESTGAGAKEVTWLREPVTDSLWKPFYLAWLLCLWLGPAYVIGRSLAGAADAPWLGFAVPVFVAWALYPVSQLSSLSASSVWIPLHPQVFARLAQKPAATVGFFALTLPVFAVGGIAFRWAFLTADEWELLFAGAPLLALAGLLYARLLGRLAFALMFTRDVLARKKKKKPQTAVRLKEAAEEPATVSRPVGVQPSELPPIMTLDGELTGYNILMADDPPAPKRRVKAELAEDGPPPAAPPSPRTAPANRSAKPAHPLERSRTWTEDDDDASPYAMHASEVKDEERIPEAVLKPKVEEMALLDRRDTPKPPKSVWSPELLAFLLQPGTITALAILSATATAAGVMVRVARQFNPVAGAE
jgi:hypothetical protein